MWNDNTVSSDYLFYKPYASIIARAAMDRSRSPLTIGVFGSWGTGKTTLLSMVQDEIENKAQDKGTLCIRLNAWTFEGYDDAKTALMEALLQSLQEKQPFLPYREKIKNIFSHLNLMKVSSILMSAGLPIALRMLMGATGGTFVSVNTKSTADGLTEMVPKLTSEFTEAAGQNNTMQSIRKFREELESLLQSADVQNIVVLLDDLDRCMPDAIIDMLEAIRLFLTIPKLTFVVAADDDVIKYAVNRKYPDKDNLDLNLAGEYVEKMFQYSLYIPGLSNKDIENNLLLLAARSHLEPSAYSRIIQELHDTRRILDKKRIEADEILSMIVRWNLPVTGGQSALAEDLRIIDQVRGLISFSLKGNPRKAKHFMNTLETKLELGELYFGVNLRKDVLAKLMALREIDPDLFLTLYVWNQGFTTENSQMARMTAEVLGNPAGTSYSEWRKPLVLKWLTSEPVGLEKLRLDRYFYLFRECLPVPGSPMILQSDKAEGIARKEEAPALALASAPVITEPAPQAAVPADVLPEAEKEPAAPGAEEPEAEPPACEAFPEADWNISDAPEEFFDTAEETKSNMPSALEALLYYPI